MGLYPGLPHLFFCFSLQFRAMTVPLGLLLALLGYIMALDPALEEAWEGWKSLYAKEYPGVRLHQLRKDLAVLSFPWA